MNQLLDDPADCPQYHLYTALTSSSPDQRFFLFPYRLYTATLSIGNSDSDKDVAS